MGASLSLNFRKYSPVSPKIQTESVLKFFNAIEENKTMWS
jgi:hypothetical protein